MALDVFEFRYSDYALADDELAVRDAFRGFFTVECPTSRVRAAESLGFDPALLGPDGVLCEGTPGAPGGGEIDFAHRYAQGTATYGGSVEVYRTMVAEQVLGLPRPAYPGAKVLVPKKR